MIERFHREIPIARQCELVGLSRSTYYFCPCGESELNLELMRRIDEEYTRHPFYGSPKITQWLWRQGYRVNHKRVERLMRLMGIEAIRPGPKTSRPDREHVVYPYLLRDVEIVRPNQVWCADITYIRMLRGFLYLVAIMDWFSRYVLSWRLSNTLDAGFCVEALRLALEIARPEIFNSDQGSQFTSEEHVQTLLAAGVRISMDGRGRVLDNIFIERLWRSVKYEEVYLHEYDSGEAAHDGLGRYFGFYNTERPHQALGYRTQEEVYATALVS